MSNKPLKRQLIENQIELIEKVIRLAKINIVNCCRCDSVILHQTKAKNITCPYCEHTSEQSDFEDFLYDGMVNNICD